MGRINRISAFLTRASHLTILVFIFLFLSACTRPSRIVSIISSSKHLFVITHDWSIKVYDPSTHKLLDSIDIPEKIHNVNGFGEIVSVLEDHGKLFIQASTIPSIPKAQSNIYLVHGKEIKKISSLPPESLLVGVDGNYVYVVEMKRSDKDEKEYFLKGFKYDKEMQEQKQHHFPEYTDLVIADLWEDRNCYWYACIRNPAGSYNPKGGFWLLSKDKHSGNLELFEMGGTEFIYKTITLTGDTDSIWILGVDLKAKGGREKILRFSKMSKDIDKSVNAYQFQLFKTSEIDEGSQFLWLLKHKNVYRLDKENLGIYSIGVEIPGEDPGFARKRPVFSDLNNLWLAASIYDYKREEYTAYLFRVSKRNADCELISLDPQLTQIFKVIETGFYTGVLPPIMAIVLLSFGAMVTGFGFLNIRGMRGRGITAGIQIMVIVLIILAPLLRNLILEEGLFILFAVLGLTSVLFSRTLVYMIKSLKARMISWMLTIFFSIISVAFFELLILATYRFSVGESGWGIVVFAIYGGIIIGIVSLILNLREQSR